MTTAPELPEVTVDDIEHPTWCELSTCHPASQPLGLPGESEHYSVGTMWPSRADGAHNTVRLLHADDIALDRRDHAQTIVELAIHQTEAVNPDGSAIRLATWLLPEDARMLAAALHRYADDADSDNLHAIRVPASEIRD